MLTKETLAGVSEAAAEKIWADVKQMDKYTKGFFEVLALRLGHAYDRLSSDLGDKQRKIIQLMFEIALERHSELVVKYDSIPYFQTFVDEFYKLEKAFVEMKEIYESNCVLIPNLKEEEGR